MGLELELYYLPRADGDSVAKAEKIKFEEELRRIAPHLHVEVSVRPPVTWIIVAL
jgi:hypothetical protein